jgi:hypothetical protein
LSGDISPEIAVAISHDNLPWRWSKLVGFVQTRQTSKVILALHDRADFFDRWLKNGLFGNYVNLADVRNVKGLLQSYLAEVSLQRGQTGETPSLVFQLSDGIKEHDPGLILNDAYLVGANFNMKEGKIVASSAKASPFMNIQQLVCVPRWNVGSHFPREDEYMCPFCWTLPAVLGGPDDQLDWENTICSVPLSTAVPASQLTLDGVVMVCQLPWRFIM